MPDQLQLAPLPFPTRIPADYESFVLADEPAWDPAVHLALASPSGALSLLDLGYDSAESALAASPLGVTAPFQVFSPAGLEAVRMVCLALQANAMVGTDDRAPSYIPGAGYRSKFIHDLCHDATVVAHVSALAGIALAPHSMADCQAYINYAPRDVSKAVDSWHIDSIAFDMVLMLSDPTKLVGGRLEFLKMSRQRASDLFGTTVDQLHLGYPLDVPEAELASAQFSAAGTGVVQQGTHVVHRASRLETAGERITLVLGYIPLDQSGADPTNVDYMATWGHPGISAELARHAAWLSSQQLAALVAQIDPDASAASAATALRAAVANVERVISALDSSG